MTLDLLSRFHKSLNWLSFSRMRSIEFFRQYLSSQMFSYYKPIWWPKLYFKLILWEILRGPIFAKKPFKFQEFFLRGIHFRKYVKFACRENKIKKVLRLSISGHLIRKSFYFLTNLWWLWSVCTKQCHHSKQYVSVECLEATIKKCLENW